MIAMYVRGNLTITNKKIVILEPYFKKSDILLDQFENIINTVFNAMKLPKSVGEKVVFNPTPHSKDIIQLLSQNSTEASLMWLI